MAFNQQQQQAQVPGSSGTNSQSSRPGPSGVNCQSSHPGPSGINSQSSRPGPSGINSQSSHPGPSGINSQSSHPGPSGINSQSSNPGPSGINSQSSRPGSSGIYSQLNRPGLSGVNTASSGQPLSSSAINILHMRQINEHKRLFSFPNGAGKRKSCKKDKEKKQSSCTLKFVALSEVNAVKPPVKIRDRTALINAGLGEATIKLSLDMNSVQCHERILERFPKLKVTGYEMLLFQRGEDSGFVKIEGAQTPQWLKNAAGASKIYLRPLQKDLDLNDEGNADELQVAI